VGDKNTTLNCRNMSNVSQIFLDHIPFAMPDFRDA
jgi:hypothetical protein